MRLILIVILFIPGFASARVFDFNKETVAAYLRGTGVMSKVGGDAFANSSGAATKTTDEVKYNFGGEFGVLFAVSPSVNMRLGLELYQAKPLPSAKGKSAAGAEWFDLKSTVFSWAPVGTLEIVVQRGPSYRLFTYAGAGYADITMENAYTMTSAGSTALGVSSYTEKAAATSVFTFAGIGMETQFVDATTLSLDVGYRYFPVSKFTYKSDETTIQGAKAKGGTVVNNDGSTRGLDLGGITFSVALRFYIDLI